MDESIIPSIESYSNRTDHVTEKDRNENTPLYANVADKSSFHLIVTFFFGFSAIVTTALFVQLYYSRNNIEQHGSVVSDDKICSIIGRDVLKKGGNSIDAAVAMSFCMGVVHPHITGLGSCGYILIYSQQERKLLDSIDFRVSKLKNNGDVGVPGFVAGMVLAHKLYGSLPWKMVVKPAEQVARNGFIVSSSLKDSQNIVYNEKLLDWFNSIQKGVIAHNLPLAGTLKSLYEADPMDFYRNETKLLRDLKYLNIDNENKIRNYEALREPGLKNTFMNFNIIVPGYGSGGPILLDNLKKINSSLSPLVSIVNAFKDVAGKNSLHYGSHIATTDANDMYVTIVSGLGSILGSQVLTQSGYIINNIVPTTTEFDDNRPQSLYTPVIALEMTKVCGRRLIIGGGDVREVAQVLVKLIRDYGLNISSIIDEPRIHIKTPVIEVEGVQLFSETDEITLRNMNISIKNINATSYSHSSINVIQKINDIVEAYADARGGGYSITF